MKAKQTVDVRSKLSDILLYWEKQNIGVVPRERCKPEYADGMADMILEKLIPLFGLGSIDVDLDKVEMKEIEKLAMEEVLYRIKSKSVEKYLFDNKENLNNLYARMADAVGRRIKKGIKI